MKYLALEIEVNPWEGYSYEIIARSEQGSARQISRFPLGASALAARLSILQKALAGMDLSAGRVRSEEERAVEELAAMLYRFLFSGEVAQLLEQTRAAAVMGWKGLRLRLRVSAPALQGVPWEVLWDILAFDLKSMRRGLFDLRVERESAPSSGSAVTALPARRLGAATKEASPHTPLQPRSSGASEGKTASLLRQADEAFYAVDFARAIELYTAGLQLEPELAQPQERLARARACLENCQPATSVPPRAATGYRRAWEAYTLYRFAEALRWLDEAWLLARDWGIAEWPEAATFRRQVERAQNGYLNYCEGLARCQAGNLTGAIEAVAQACRADPLQAYRAQLARWGADLSYPPSPFSPPEAGREGG